MSTQIGSINAASSTSSASASAASTTAPKLTDDTKQKLQALGIDTSGITSEAQGQIALLQAQQLQAQKGQHGEKSHSGGRKAEMDAMKLQATELANKAGVSVSADEKLSDIMAAIEPAISAKVSAAGNDQSKLAEVQELETEYGSISASLSEMQAQHSQGAQSAQGAQGAQSITSSLNNMAAQNKLYHQV